jgi:hypothetical protein
MKTNRLACTLTILLLASCVCTTVFSPVTIKSSDREYELAAQIREGAFDTEPDQLEIDFIFCNSPASVNKCTDKKLVTNSLKIIPSFSVDNEIPFIKEYASTFYFGSSDFKKNWRNQDKLFIKLNYQVDSLGIILTHNHEYLLIKDNKCRFRPVLH